MSKILIKLKGVDWLFIPATVEAPDRGRGGDHRAFVRSE